MARIAGKNLIVLIHGGASSSRMYNNVIPFLTMTDSTIFALDLPGHGSVASQGPFTFEAAVQSVTDCITKHTDPPGHAYHLVMLVGISLGGQVVLSFLQSNPELIDAAIVSGASIHPPDEAAKWEMPHMPSDQASIDMMMEDVALAGMDNMPGLQAQSFGFTFSPPQPASGSKGKFPPVLVMIGEHDTPMSRRDFEELTEICRGANGQSEGMVLKGAWHNHNIDVPEQFADVVKEWMRKVF